MKNLINNADHYVQTHIEMVKDNQRQAINQLRNTHANLREAHDHATEDLQINLRSQMEYISRIIHDLEVNLQSYDLV